MEIGLGVLGMLLLIGSLLSWMYEQRPKGAIRTEEETNQAKIRALLLALWALIVPLYFFWEWYKVGVDVKNLPLLQYRNKVMSDAWTAIAVVLGVLAGVKKF